MAKLKYLVIHCTATPEGVRYHRRTSGSGTLRPKPGWQRLETAGYTDLFHLQGGVERLVNNNEDAQVDPWK